MSLVWLTSADICTINARAVARSGEPFLVRDEGLLDSACAKPINLWHYEDERDLVRLAAALLLGIARNHPFGQGNKRTALAAAFAFLEINGEIVALPDEPDELADAIVSVIDGSLTEAAFISELRQGVDASRPKT